MSTDERTYLEPTSAGQLRSFNHLIGNQYDDYEDFAWVTQLEQPKSRSLQGLQLEVAAQKICIRLVRYALSGCDRKKNTGIMTL